MKKQTNTSFRWQVHVNTKKNRAPPSPKKEYQSSVSGIHTLLGYFHKEIIWMTLRESMVKQLKLQPPKEISFQFLYPAYSQMLIKEKLVFNQFWG